jgi:hypothetical protein
MTTERQQHWCDAASRSTGLAAQLFTLLAEPTPDERGHDHRSHVTGFSLNGRRGLRCGVDKMIIRWIDPEAV